MKTVVLPDGERVPALGQGTWNMGDDRAKRSAEIAALPAFNVEAVLACPTGAITYAYPSAPYQGRKLKTLLNTYASAGGRDAVVLLHNGERGRALIEQLVAPTGQWLWVRQEADLDAVTALSGSGPAYVFYFVEAMMAAAVEMGLTEEQGRTLALATFGGATTLASQSSESPAVLRERVTSKGGTTYAALTAMDNADMKQAFVKAMQAAQQRARELGDEFGR